MVDTNDAQIDAHVAALASDDSLSRLRARQALIAFGPAVVERLIAVLTDPNDHVRWEAAKALSEIRAPSSAEALVAALRDDKFGVRWLAAEGLCRLGESGLVALLRGIEDHSDDVWLRDGAEHVLRCLSQGKLREISEPVLLALLDPAPDLKAPLAAEKALASLPPARQLPVAG